MSVEHNAGGGAKRTEMSKDASFWLEALGIGEDVSLMPSLVVEELYSMGFAKVSINRAGLAFLEAQGWKFI